MKIGVCVGMNIDRAILAKKLGYDYVESNCGDIVKAPFENIEKMKSVGIPVYATNCFIGQRIISPDKDDNAISEYLNELFKRCNYLGIKTIVFGSSGARKALEGQDTEMCREEIYEFIVKHVVPLCEKYDIRIAIEPLGPKECNVINTIEQGVEIAERVNNKYINVLADLKHMISSEDSLDNIVKYKDLLIHAHTSNPYPEIEGKKRVYPREGDKFNQDLFFKPLIEAGVEYCSIEADVIDFEDDAAEAIKVLRKYMD